MSEFAIALLAAAVIGIPILILLKKGCGKKRGCGEDCAACGSREICRGRKKSPQKEKQEERH